MSSSSGTHSETGSTTSSETGQNIETDSENPEEYRLSPFPLTFYFPSTRETGLELCTNGSIRRKREELCEFVPEMPSCRSPSPSQPYKADAECQDKSNGRCIDGFEGDYQCLYLCKKNSDDCGTNEACLCGYHIDQSEQAPPTIPSNYFHHQYASFGV